mgnify:CR=1 FL=1
MRVAYLLLPALITLPSLANAQSELIALQPDRILSGDKLYESGEWLLIQEGYVVEVVSTEAELPPDADKKRLNGKTIIPALIDAHAHLGYQSVTSWGAENYNEANLLDNLSQYAYYGFSTALSYTHMPMPPQRIVSI